MATRLRRTAPAAALWLERLGPRHPAQVIALGFAAAILVALLSFLGISYDGTRATDHAPSEEDAHA